MCPGVLGTFMGICHMTLYDSITYDVRGKGKAWKDPLLRCRTKTIARRDQSTKKRWRVQKQNQLGPFHIHTDHSWLGFVDRIVGFVLKKILGKQSKSTFLYRTRLTTPSPLPLPLYKRDTKGQFALKLCHGGALSWKHTERRNMIHANDCDD